MCFVWLFFVRQEKDGVITEGKGRAWKGRMRRETERSRLGWATG